MISYFKINFCQLNKFLKKIIFIKIYLTKLKNRSLFLIKTLKLNYKTLSFNINNNNGTNFLIAYVIKICFSKTNTFTQINNTFGMLKFLCSAGHLLYKGKNKKARIAVLKDIIHFLIKKLDVLKKKAVVLHLKNVGFKKN